MGQSRSEDILENILGAENPLGEPQSREEQLLMAILNGDTEPPFSEAQSREESLLMQIIENGGGSGGDFGIVEIFSDGEWKNTDILEHTLSETGAEYMRIEDGCIIYESDGSGISFNVPNANKQFYLFIKFSGINSAAYAQSGRCAVGADARRCQNEGYQRYSYHDARPGTNEFILNNYITKYNEGLFFSGNGISISKISVKIIDDVPHIVYID